MKAAYRKENMSSTSKSHIPRPQLSGKKMKARPAPDFSKLHKKWEEQLQNGLSCKKKPTTIVKPFDVTKPGTKFTVQNKVTVLNDADDFELDFEADQKALDTILHNKGLSERKVAGRTTLDVMSMSTGKIKKKSCTNLGKRRILGELPCDPDQLSDDDRVVSAKKALEFDAEKKNITDFEEDPDALISILNDEGITVASSTDDRQTFAGSVIRSSLLQHPIPARQSCMSAVTKTTYSKTDTEALIQSVRDKQRSDCKQPNSKSPFKTNTSVVTDSPFGQRVMRPGRNSIYGNYHIYPMSSPAVTRHRNLLSQHSSPSNVSDHVQKNLKKELHREMHKSVKWSDVLESCTYYSPCAVPKIKEKKTLFSTIDEIDNDIDSCKENIEPSQQHEIDKSEINNSSDVTYTSDGQKRDDSSFVATASQNSATAVVCSMTHSKLLEPRQQPLLNYNTTDTTPCKVLSNTSSHQNVQVGTSGKSTLAARRIPITAAKHDSDIPNCVSVTASEKYRTFCKNIEKPFHQSGISSLPKQGGTEDGTTFNLSLPHSNLRSVKVPFDDAVNHNCDDLELQVKSETLLSKEAYPQEMAMHTEEKEESDDSDNVGRDPHSQTGPQNARSDNESVDNFVGRVKKSRKRQSIVELNESIVESQVHMHKLQAETEKLQDVKEVEGSQTNLNILQQLQLIAEQQEQLQFLQKQLQEELQQQQTSTSLSHDRTSAIESNNNFATNMDIGVTRSSDNFRVSCTQNILNNNVILVKDNQTIVSQPLSIFASSSAAFSQTLSPSRTWSPCKDLTLTPSKRQPRVAIDTQFDITPYVTKTISQRDEKLIKHPTPVKTEFSYVNVSSTSSVPPLWTPLALSEASQDQQNINLTPKICDNDIKTCTSQVAAIDLSVKRPKEDDHSAAFSPSISAGAGPVSPQPKPTPISAFTRVCSPNLNDNQNVGSLSLRANTLMSPVDLSSRKKRLSMRRNIIAVSSERYQEALLDDECALYSCRLQTPGFTGRSYVNPVATVLQEGDEMHFIPIREDSPVRHYIREGSAFSCYSP
ncbi:uncharacterized protein LOC127730942 [Mytilus californianus]|uniref:uncharacterized protein LOC127730942 n=1 Tax=Mytilus californianus TaxID=6549 RepID=UPI0022466D85|nr:uncharacterized protein LOC127730942 [Mytilus californianus]